VVQVRQNVPGEQIALGGVRVAGQDERLHAVAVILRHADSWATRSAVTRARVREAQDREARKGRRTGGRQRWFGYTRIYANPDEPNHKKRHILREEINPVEAEAVRDAATRVLEHRESVASIARDWTAWGIRPLPADANANVAGNSKNTALRRERELAVLRQRVEFDWRM
jgi:hypothetical protein